MGIDCGFGSVNTYVYKFISGSLWCMFAKKKYEYVNEKK